MVSLAEQSFADMFSHNDTDEYSRYPDPPHSASSYDANTTPMDMNSMYGLPSVGFEQSLYAEASNYIINHNRASPGLYHEEGDLRLPSASLSTNSATSSDVPSPESTPGHPLGSSSEWNPNGPHPSIVSNDFEYVANHEYTGYPSQGMEEFAYDYATQSKGYVDPSLINPDNNGAPMNIPSYDTHFQQLPHQVFPTSPSASSSSPPLKMLRGNSTSPFLQNGPFHQSPPFPHSPDTVPADPSTRRPSVSSFVSPTSGEYGSGDENKEKQRCTYPDCGKVFKDLKAHMLTHQHERPEKCPIQTCEYHTKGFARKYDKNRHTLTHYKGTMVCGFCPGSGSAIEKSFNRADVFKRHLTAVHNVEQTPPNSRKKSPTGMGHGKKLSGYAPDATGKCSTCSQTFANAQDFYEHLDDCVLRIVQQEDPAEAINAQCLTEMDQDKDFQETLERNALVATPSSHTAEDDDEDADDDMEDEADDGSSTGTSSYPKKKSSNGVQKSRGMTHSRGGVPLSTKSRGRKNRDKRYPPSWGYDPAKMTLRHRVLTVFDGPRRLAKDDMALSTSHEVRLKLSDGKSYTTDLDIQTLKRAEGFHTATEEEKGPWISDDPTETQFQEMQTMVVAK